MTIDFKSPMGALQDGIIADFAARSISASVTYGWRERTKSINQGPGGANRVVIVPSDLDGNGGDMGATAKYPGAQTVYDMTTPEPTPVGRVRSLRDWPRLGVISIWAHDDTDPTNERLQTEAVEQLQREVMRAVNRVEAQDFKWTKTRWTVSPTELRNGAELLMWFTVRDSIFDVPDEFVFPTGKLTPDPAKVPAA